ncbi:uncharacterized protein LOC131429808 isoform X2 [Malaya genurostris]|uniref:uncharacterized protein LOC131429808 isoform X2 n=1 Tax=Malaya genurostris TaxID=325434 RepID=UPI0026F3A0EA|nr:uncharacterized protein LOC131429808 isoform X2 [Malaya genurostris]
MDQFWHEMVKVTGPVSATVRAALEQTKFIHVGLKFLDDQVIDTVEADIRRLPAMLRKSEDEVAQMLAYPGDINEFRFMVGERSVMKLIAENVRQFGFNCFYKMSLSGTQRSVEQQTYIACMDNAQQTTSDSVKPKKQRSYSTSKRSSSSIPWVRISANSVDDNRILNVEEEEVKSKIRTYFEKKCDESEEQVLFCQQLVDIRVEVEQDSCGDMARITCPFCDQVTAQIRRDKSGSWKISNFSAHIKYHHNDLNYPGKKSLLEISDTESRPKSRSARKRSRSIFSMQDFVDAHCEQTVDQLDSAIKIEVLEV